MPAQTHSSVASLDVRLFIDGAWREGSRRDHGAVIDPATGLEIGRVAHACADDLGEAAEAARHGSSTWRAVPAVERYRLLRRAAANLRQDAGDIALAMTREQGKPLDEARGEVERGADAIEWFAEEGRRIYGRAVPPREPRVEHIVLREPVGPVAAFTPWNFPVNQAVRKVAAALASGCSVILKGPEETPASCAALVAAFDAAGLPAGVLNLVFGVPSEISRTLIAHPFIRKVSFTGSTAVGKQLASLAGLHMKRITMELGGHAPVIVARDADVENAASRLAALKFRNAGQVCTAPSRFLVARQVHDAFVECFVAAASSLRVGNGLTPGIQMGPLANRRRVDAMESFIADAEARGATLATGGRRGDGDGFFYPPTVLTGVPSEARLMNDEPFGPVAPIRAFDDIDEAIAEANRLPVGLSAYAFTRSASVAARITDEVECGMLSINLAGGGGIELPFGGIKESGYGSEGGAEAMDSYLTTKVVSRAMAA